MKKKALPVKKDESDNVVQEVISSVIDLNSGDRQMKFFLYWMLGCSPKGAAKTVGYTRDWGYKLLHQYKNDKKGILREKVSRFLDVFPEQYKSVCKLRLAQVANIEGKALDLYEESPQLAIDKPGMLKQVKQGAGVLEESIPTVPTLNLIEIRAHVKHTYVEGTKQDKDIIDVSD